MSSKQSQEAVLHRLCHILAACEKLTSVSILGESKRYRPAPLWKILLGLTTVTFSRGYLDLRLLLQLDKLRELCIEGNAGVHLYNPKDTISSHEVAAVPFSESRMPCIGNTATLGPHVWTCNSDDSESWQCVWMLMTNKLSLATVYLGPLICAPLTLIGLSSINMHSSTRSAKLMFWPQS